MLLPLLMNLRMLGQPAPSNFSLREWRNWHREDAEKRGLELESVEVIDDVATRQAADFRQDDQQRLDELRGELLLRGLEMRSAHIEALNEHRAALVAEELRRLFRERQDNADIEFLLLIASNA